MAELECSADNPDTADQYNENWAQALHAFVTSVRWEDELEPGDSTASEPDAGSRPGKFDAPSVTRPSTGSTETVVSRWDCFVCRTAGGERVERVDGDEGEARPVRAVPLPDAPPIGPGT